MMSGLVSLDGAEWPRVKVTGKTRTKRYLCEKCGTWVCTQCGTKRPYANRSYPGVFTCNGCGCMTGTWRVTYHSRQAWYNHNEKDPEEKP